MFNVITNRVLYAELWYFTILCLLQTKNRLKKLHSHNTPMMVMKLLFTTAK